MSVNTIPSFFIRDFAHWRKIELFRRLLYIFLLLNTLSLLPIAKEIWSYHGIVGTRGWNFAIPTFEQGSYALLNVLSHPANAKYPWVYIVFIIAQIAFLLTGILRVIPKISSFMVYFFTANLFLKGYMMFTGAEVLISLLLFYLMFIQKSNSQGWKISFKISKDEKPEFGVFQNTLNNTFYWILLIQICFVYFFSTFYKLFDWNWISGSAVMYVSRVDTYSSGLSRFLFADNYVLSLIASYLILIYQAFFPILVWVKKVKIPFLIFGVIFHLGIAFGMGIFTFGIVMCLVYLLFLDLEQIDKLKSKFSFKRSNPVT